jgi:hypothetical protein
MLKINSCQSGEDRRYISTLKPGEGAVDQAGDLWLRVGSGRLLMLGNVDEDIATSNCHIHYNSDEGPSQRWYIAHKLEPGSIIEIKVN